METPFKYTTNISEMEQWAEGYARTTLFQLWNSSKDRNPEHYEMFKRHLNINMNMQSSKN